MSQDTVYPGDPISASEWNALQKAANFNQVLLGGDETRVSRYPRGIFINSKIGGGYNHPFRVMLSTTAARVSPGTINGEYPTIKDINGVVGSLKDNPAPLLSVTSTSLKFSQFNVGWIALELQLEEDYRTIKTAEIVQCDSILGSDLKTNSPFFFFGLPGIGDFKVRYPIARLQHYPEVDATDIFQVAMFNLNHTCKPPAQTSHPGEIAQSSLPRHFFWPV